MPAGPNLPRTLYPILKGLLLSPDGTVWSLIEDLESERVARLDPRRGSVAPDAQATDIAAYELLLMSPN